MCIKDSNTRTCNNDTLRIIVADGLKSFCWHKNIDEVGPIKFYNKFILKDLW